MRLLRALRRLASNCLKVAMDPARATEKYHRVALCSHLNLEAERTNYFQDRSEFRIAF